MTMMNFAMVLLCVSVIGITVFTPVFSQQPELGVELQVVYLNVFENGPMVIGVDVKNTLDFPVEDVEVFLEFYHKGESLGTEIMTILVEPLLAHEGIRWAIVPTFENPSVDNVSITVIGYSSESKLPVVETPTTRSFSLSSALDDNSYTTVGVSENNIPLAYTIIPNEYVQFDMLGGQGGTIEITLPKKMISGIHTVKSGEQQILFQQIDSTESATTIAFQVPDNVTSLSIYGASVVPEFPAVLIVLVLVIGATIFLTKTKVSLFNKI